MNKLYLLFLLLFSVILKAQIHDSFKINLVIRGEFKKSEKYALGFPLADNKAISFGGRNGFFYYNKFINFIPMGFPRDSTYYFSLMQKDVGGTLNELYRIFMPLASDSTKNILYIGKNQKNDYYPFEVKWISEQEYLIMLLADIRKYKIIKFQAN